MQLTPSIRTANLAIRPIVGRPSMVEYALLSGMIALRELAMGAQSIAGMVNWPVVGFLASAAGVAWWASKPKGPYR